MFMISTMHLGTKVFRIIMLYNILKKKKKKKNTAAGFRPRPLHAV
jgi:hypothetical protein